MFAATPKLNQGNALGDALAAAGLSLEALTPATYDEARRSKRLKVAHVQALQEALPAVEFRRRQPQRLVQALPLLAELARLDALPLAERMAADAPRAPALWQCRGEHFGWSPSTPLGRELESRVLTVWRRWLYAALYLDPNAPRTDGTLNEATAAVCAARHEGRPAILWRATDNAGGAGFIVDAAVLAELIRDLSKRKPDFAKVTFK